MLREAVPPRSECDGLVTAVHAAVVQFPPGFAAARVLKLPSHGVRDSGKVGKDVTPPGPAWKL